MAAQQQAPPMQQGSDIDHWMNRASAAAKDPSAITTPTGTGQWENSTFDCCQPVDTCFITCCAPCVTFGKTHHRLHKDANLQGYSPINASCLGFYLVSIFGCHCFPILLQRADIRSRPTPNLQGNFAKDFIKSWCLPCCDLMQQDKEAEHLAKTGVLQVGVQPLPTAGMTYAPQ